MSRSKALPTLEELQRTSTLLLHLGELTRDELRVAKAAVRFCYTQLTQEDREERHISPDNKG